MKLLTPEQIKFLYKRTLTIGNIQLLPSWGFHAYQQPTYGSSRTFIATNPFTKSLAHYNGYVEIKELHDSFIGFDFMAKPTGKIFYVPRVEMDEREFIERWSLMLIFVPWFLLKNAFMKISRSVVFTKPRANP